MLLLVCMLHLLARQLEENVSVAGIMGSSAGVHPLRALLGILVARALYGLAVAAVRYPNRMLRSERRLKAPGGELAGPRGSVGREG